MAKKDIVNFTPFTKEEIKSIMVERNKMPERPTLYTSGGVQVYRFTMK